MEATEDVQNVAKTQLDTGLAKSKPVKLGWKAEEIESITSCLNKLLANYSVHYQKLRNYHWNVKGHDFFDLHDQFEMQYVQALEHIDQIAERVRVFGKTPLSTFKDYLAMSEIKETNSDLLSEVMVREILSDYRILLGIMYDLVAVAAMHSDSGTEEMVKVFIHKTEKHHWMFTSFLAN